MEYCYHYVKYRTSEQYGIALACFFGGLAVIHGIEAWNSTNFLRIAVWFIGMLIWLLVAILLFAAFLESSRKYTISPSGISLLYFFHKQVFIPWSKISEVSICNVHYTTRGNTEYLTAIRCVVGIEKHGPSEGYGIWADSWYSAIHFRKIITIIYSEKRHNEFIEVCPLNIFDYRSRKRYPFDL